MMVNNVSFSVVMATYNRKKMLKKSVDAVLAPTYQNFEFIVVDDGSTDGSVAYLKKHYQNFINDGKLKLIEITHGGVCKARNTGLDNAKHSWIAYVDSDNEIYSNFLETFAQAIIDNPHAEIFYAQFKNIHSGKIEGHNVRFEECLKHNCIDLGVFVHRLELYKNLGGFDESLSRLVDWDLILRYIKNNQAVFIEKVLMLYNDMPRKDRITVREDYFSNYNKILCKHSRNALRIKEITSVKDIKMKLKFLKLIRLFHLINKQKYNFLRQIELVKSSALFDEKWYLAQNPDLAKWQNKAARHYVKYGWKEGRNPGPDFDTTEYLREFPELYSKNLCPLAHYMIGNKWHVKKGAGFLNLSYILTYPIRVKEEYDALKAELKALENN